MLEGDIEHPAHDVGQQIINHGELNSTGGDIQMVAGDEVIVFTPTGENIGFELTQP